jgi:hypothetical protein
MATNYPTRTIEFDDIASTTLAWRLPGTFEQTLGSHPIIRELTRNRRRSGMGEEIQWTPTFGDNPSVQFITSSTQKFEYTGASVATTARLDPAIMVGYVTYSDEEEQKNSGDQQIADLVDLKVAQLKRTFRRKLAKAFHSAGTVDGKPAIKGLRYWVPRVPGSLVVAGLDESKFPWWQSKSRINSGAWNDNGWFGANNNYPLNMFVNLTDGDEYPSLVISDAGTLMTALNALGTDVRYTSAESFGKIGSLNMTFMGQRWVMDKDALPGTMYMLHPEDFIFVTATSGTDPEDIFTTIPMFRIPNQPLMKVQFIWGRFQLICTNRNRQGALFDWTIPA